MAEAHYGRGSPEAAAARKAYVKEVRRARRSHEDERREDMVQSWYVDPNLFWKSFKGPREPSPAAKAGSLHQWTQYFEGVLNDGGRQEGSIAQHIQGHLDSGLFHEPDPSAVASATDLNADITEAEVLAALDRMKLGAAPGVDGIPGEFFALAFDPSAEEVQNVLVPVLTHVFNVVMRQGFPSSWAGSALTPVPKPKGDPSLMDCYRGIAVGNALSKLYSMVLLDRLDGWAEMRGVRAGGQAGFRCGRSTVDNIFVLQHVIESYDAVKAPVYAAFVDFRKAYDQVDRDVLWTVLHGLGVHGKMLESLKNMYQHVRMHVRLDGVLGEGFEAGLGVKQGDPLSPLLFGLLIDTFEAFLRGQVGSTVGVQVACNIWLQVLLYADDLVLLADSPEQLQLMLDSLQSFCEATRMTVNVQKSQVTVFNSKYGRYCGGFQFGGLSLPQESSFTYLGVRFADGHPIKMTLDGNVVKARRALHAMFNQCFRVGLHSATVQSNLFNVLVQPIMEYGCEVWGAYHVSDWERCHWGDDGDAEVFHRDMLRRCFSVRRSTPGIFMLEELGRTPIMHSWFSRCCKWWNRIVCREDNDLTRICLCESVRLAISTGVKGWAWHFLQNVSQIDGDWYNTACGIGYLRVTDLVEKLYTLWNKSAWSVLGVTQSHLMDRHNLSLDSTALRDVPDDVSVGFKLITYKRWFHMPGTRSFAFYVHNPERIGVLARFRFGAHDLAVERERYHRPKPERSSRLCRLCDAGVREDEMHIFQCPAYADIRCHFRGLFDSHTHGLQTCDWGDEDFRSFVNRESYAEWNKLAIMLLQIMKKRLNELAVLVDSVAHDTSTVGVTAGTST